VANNNRYKGSQSEKLDTQITGVDIQISISSLSITPNLEQM